MAARESHLEAIDQTGGTEVGGSLYPQTADLCHHVAQYAAHGIHPHKGPDAECAGEQPGHSLPIAGDAALRPGHTRHEQQRQREEHHQQHDVLAIVNQAGHRHSKEGARQQIRYHQRHKILPMDHRYKGEHARDGDGEVCRHHSIDHQIAHRLAADDAVDAAITLMDGHQIAVTVALAGCSCG